MMAKLKKRRKGAEYLKDPKNVTYHEMSAGKVRLYRGRAGEDDEKRLFQWDAISKCDGELCIIAEQCEYVKKGNCTLEMRYMKAISSVIMRNYGEHLDEPTLYRIGIHLVPLYKILIRLKMEELAAERLILLDAKDKAFAHPVLREIRDTIRLIEDVWKKLGLGEKAPEPSLPLSEDEGDYVMRKK